MLFKLFVLSFLKNYVIYPCPTVPSLATEFRNGSRGFCTCVITARAHAVRSSVCLSSCAFINERNLLDMMKFSLTVSLAILLQVISVLVIYTSGSKGQECIKGKWHKASPSPETDEFKTCHAFKDNSCCTAEFTVELMANETRNLYNHSWHRCGQLSEKCQQFWVTQVGLILCDLIFC